MRSVIGIAVGLVLGSPAEAQVISRVSVDSNGIEGDGNSGWTTVYQQRPIAISADGNVVAFQSDATNLVPGDVNGFTDIFVRDRTTGITERVSVDSSGIAADGDSYQPILSTDGRYVVFWSEATNLVAKDTNKVADVFLRDRTNGTTERVSIHSNGSQGDFGSYRAAISSDGRFVAFESDADNLIPGDANSSTDIFLRDRQNGTTRRVSVDSFGHEAKPGGCFDPAISADGSIIAFSARSSSLVPGDTNLVSDVFVRDLVNLVTERVSVDSSGAQANGNSVHPALSTDGNVVVFESSAVNLVAGDTNVRADVFVHDRNTGTTERASVDSSGAESNDDSMDPAVSSDGRFVVFASSASNLVAVDANGVDDVFVRDRLAGTTALVSFDCAGNPGDAPSSTPDLSDDGQEIVFSSQATSLVDGDGNAVGDVFLDDLTVPPVDATWTNYASGFAGTLGVPTFASSADPVFGTSISLDASNSYGRWSVCLIFVGLQSASIPTSAGGTLLVAPLLTFLVGLPPSGASMLEQVPRDPTLCGISIYLQCLELDPGAQHGISFTPGLQLVFGH
jgi:Tol biopolymer transport system component